jgi:hypothetical protein
MKRPDWLKAAGVDEVCSASACVSKGPEDWIDQWRHNEMWVYDTLELARSVIPEPVRQEFDLYAYQMFPVIFKDGQQQPFEIPPLQVQPLPESFERLGYDAVSRSFAHSPLSCNYMTEHEAVNRYCLVDDVDTAFRLAAEFEGAGCEPGPYHVVEVWRQRSNRA